MGWVLIEVDMGDSCQSLYDLPIRVPATINPRQTTNNQIIFASFVWERKESNKKKDKFHKKTYPCSWYMGKPMHGRRLEEFPQDIHWQFKIIGQSINGSPPETRAELRGALVARSKDPVVVMTSNTCSARPSNSLLAIAHWSIAPLIHLPISLHSRKLIQKMSPKAFIELTKASTGDIEWNALCHDPVSSGKVLYS